MNTPQYPYEYTTPHYHSRGEVDDRARWIARSEGRTEISQLDRVRAVRELRLAATES